VPGHCLLDFAFFVRGVFVALGAELLHFEFVGGFAFVLVGCVERSAVAGAVQSDFVSHGSLSLLIEK
jgi:hypothetical protein